MEALLLLHAADKFHKMSRVQQTANDFSKMETGLSTTKRDILLPARLRSKALCLTGSSQGLISPRTGVNNFGTFETSSNYLLMFMLYLKKVNGEIVHTFSSGILFPDILKY